MCHFAKCNLKALFDLMARVHGGAELSSSSLDARTQAAGKEDPGLLEVRFRNRP